ncbi:Phospholipase/carboxylesterase [Cylindrobasidium torrendii FP15055 ss-10]|uniref:Acyl-protein thioesterase 1 n=1 Tax=Cylindrobasidium torrendii FP15055 ss-10 TaxID=1314674 RepID=A0A0D7BUN9_9AGAR|nr:Phospholipase/carboxylesterase [Cylindrobasidium torrendii FP15055 ss-10]
MSAALRYLTVGPSAAHKATIVFIHGLGDSGHGWEPVARMLGQDPGLKHVKWILPHAPQMPVSVNMGMTMSSWFDIPKIPVESRKESDYDEENIMANSKLIQAIIDKEIESGTDSRKIVVGGFSQGGVMAVVSGLAYNKPLGGIVILSSFVPLVDKIQKLINPAQDVATLPVFVAHGTEDPVIDVQLADTTLDLLTKLGFARAGSGSANGVTFNKYPMGHSTCMEELQRLTSWLKQVVSSS